MALSTIEQAYALARSGQVPNFESLKHRLKADGCRAVDALLAPRTISAHLTAICAATFQPPTESSPVSEPDGGAVTPE
jgi:hypothetical protein